jgi:hypothetical protein
MLLSDDILQLVTGRGKVTVVCGYFLNSQRKTTNICHGSRSRSPDSNLLLPECEARVKHYIAMFDLDQLFVNLWKTITKSYYFIQTLVNTTFIQLTLVLSMSGVVW